MSYKILIAQDDIDAISVLQLYLEAENYEVFAVQSGADALKVLNRQDISLVILDVLLPDTSGYEITRIIRRDNNIPIMILSAKDHEYDRILGLNLGADDYLTKPFNPMEVMAKVNANIRRFYKLGAAYSTVEAKRTLTVGEIDLEMETFTVRKRGVEIPLTSTEFKILSKLMNSPNRIFGRENLYESATGDYLESNSNTVNMHISKLREKIEDDPKKPKYIKTVKGVGYKFEKGDCDGEMAKSCPGLF